MIWVIIIKGYSITWDPAQVRRINVLEKIQYIIWLIG